MFSRRIFSATILAFVFFVSSAKSAEISFYSYPDAVELAKAQGRMVYVLFGGDHCPWCHKQKDVLSDDEVTKALSKYVVCYVDVPSEKSLARRYNVKSMPASLLIDSDETTIRKSLGYMDKFKFLNWIR